MSCESVPSFAAKANAFTSKTANQGESSKGAAEQPVKTPRRARAEDQDGRGHRLERDRKGGAGSDRVQEVLPEHRPDAGRALRRVSRN